MKPQPNTLLLVALLLIFTQISFARTYYVSVTGNDSNVGYEVDAPFRSLKKALSKSDMNEIIIRGGTYYINLDSTVNISRVGTSPGAFIMRNYPGERPLFDCSGVNTAKKGFNVTGSYWYITGLDIMRAKDNGMFISGSYNIIEFCTFFENEDSGLQLSSGASYNKIINCDSYYNKDPTSENADGFACKLDVGNGNSFKGCRAWQNSDDGWDGYLRGTNYINTTIDSCWSFRNGYLKTGSLSGANGDGNGFKMGGSDSTSLSHNQTLTHCIAFLNRKKGFDQNNNRGSMTLYNNTAYANGGGNFMMNSVSLAAGSIMTVKNCIAFTTTGTSGTNNFVSGAVLQKNSFQQPFSVSNNDFISLDTTGLGGASGPRKPDGSLPDINFLHLARGSGLVDGGQDVGLVFAGSAPDLGAFETSPAASATYTFNGNGNWNDAANWLNNTPPPATLNPGNQILINPVEGGQCILNIPYTVSPGAVLTVLQGKQLIIQGNLDIAD